MKKKFLYIFLSLFFISSSVYLLYPNLYGIQFNKKISISEIDKYSIFISYYDIGDTSYIENNALRIKTNKIVYWLIISRDDVVNHREIPFAEPTD